MRAIVLGSAAGGGFPQWNSGSEACSRARRGDAAAQPRTQASIAVSQDTVRWFLVNASPDLRSQIEQSPDLHPVAGGRSSPIRGVVLTGAEVDTLAGLLTLRERQKLTVLASSTVLRILSANPIFNVLAHDVVRRVRLALDTVIDLPDTDGAEVGLTCRLFAVPGKPPLFLEESEAPSSTLDDTTVGAEFSDGRSRLCFIPGCAAFTADLAARLRGADCVLFDGTLFTDDEMVRLGVSAKTGRRMGHMSVSGEDGAIAAFADLDVRRKIFIHINNTNPILLDDSPEHAAVRAAGWEVAYDGLRIDL